MKVDRNNKIKNFPGPKWARKNKSALPPWAPRGPFSDDQSDEQSLSLSLSISISDDHLSDDHLSDDQFDQSDDQF